MDLISIESQEIINKIDQELLAYVPAKPPILNQACEMSLIYNKSVHDVLTPHLPNEIVHDVLSLSI